YKDDRREVIGGGGGTRYLGNHYGKVIWAQYPVPKDHRWYDHDATKDDVNFYVKWQEKVADRLFLFGDLQYRGVSYRIDGFRDNPKLQVDESWGFLNPKLGLTWLGNGQRAYLSYAKGAKEPNRDDFEAGAAQRPRAEKLHDFEAGYETSGGRFSWGITGYYMRYRDQLVLTGRINDVGAYTRTNIPESYRAGVELTGRWKPSETWEARGNLTLSDNRVMGLTTYYDDYDNGGQQSERIDRSPIAYSPSVTAAASLSWKPFRTLSVSLPAKYVGRQYLDNTGRESRSLDPFFVQDLVLSWSPGLRIARETVLTLMVNNLLDARYEPNGYTYSYLNPTRVSEVFLYPQAQRNFMLGLMIEY
ncbi:MAG: TonB-dependent receptor, partial [Chitinophagia bacterium]|nr:TonB-dependent receptor [Chitinophagia bacterium]